AWCCGLARRPSSEDGAPAGRDRPHAGAGGARLASARARAWTLTWLADPVKRPWYTQQAMGDVGLMGMHVPGMSWREMREAAVLGGGLGYGCLWGGESGGGAALPSRAHLAAVPSRLRIGTSIVPVFAPPPANLAMSALNMDRMSDGRFFLGLGTSG